MDEFLQAGFNQLLRVSIVTSISVALAAILMWFTRLRPSTRVLAWMFVLLQCWFLCSIVVEVPWYEPVESKGSTVSQASLGLPFGFETLESQPAAPPATETVSVFSQLQIIILAIWILGGLFLTAKYIRSFKLLGEAIAHCPKLEEIDHPNRLIWLDEMNCVRRELGISQPVQFRLSQQVGPMVCRTKGQYSLVVPESVWNDIPKNQRTVILQHELSHLKRGDVWKVFAARILMLPQWFNPLAWLALRQFDAAIEMACDDYVLDRTSASPIEYAKSLVSLIEFNHQPSGMALAIGGPPVRKRIKRIVQPKGLEMKFARMLTVVLLLTVSLFGLLKLELVAQETNSATSPSIQAPDSSAEHGVERNAIGPSSPVFVYQVVDDSLSATGQKPETNANANDEKIVTKSYNVIDLVMPKVLPNSPLPPVFGVVGQHPLDGTMPMLELGGISEQDFIPLSDLIKSVVDPESWKPGGSGKLNIFVPNLQLIIATTKKNHEQIEDLLTKVRELSAITVTLDAFVKIVPEGHAIAKGLTPGKPQLVEQKVAQRWLKEFGPMFGLPKSTLYNGQMMTHRELKIKDTEIECLSMQPLLTFDFNKTGKSICDVTLFCMSASETVLHNGPPKQMKGTGVQENPKMIGAKVAKPLDEKTAETAKTLARLENKIDPTIMTGLIDMPAEGYARFDVTGFVKNPKKGIRAVVIVKSTVVDKRAEIAKLPKPKVMK